MQEAAAVAVLRRMKSRLDFFSLYVSATCKNFSCRSCLSALGCGASHTNRVQRPYMNVNRRLQPRIVKRMLSHLDVSSHFILRLLPFHDWR